MKAIIGVNIKCEVQSAIGTAVTIQSIEQNTAGLTEVGATGHAFLDGDVVVFFMTTGMAQLDRQAVRVSNKTANTFEAEDLDITGYEAFSAGTVRKISTFATLGAAQQVSAPNPAPVKIDTTTLIDLTKQSEYGLEEAPDGTFSCLFNPAGTTEALIRTATNSKTPMGIRITYADGRQTVMNANVSGGYGFEIAGNDAAKSSVAFTPIKLMMHYAAL